MSISPSIWKLDPLPDFLTDHTLTGENLSDRLKEYAARWVQFAGAANAIETDGELTANEIALETATALRQGGPWGQAFPEPCFDGEFQIRSARVVGERHLKMWVEIAPGGRTFDAIAFNHIEDFAAFTPPAGKVQLVYRLDINEYQGERRLQLLVDHIL